VLATVLLKLPVRRITRQPCILCGLDYGVGLSDSLSLERLYGIVVGVGRFNAKIEQPRFFGAHQPR
jgi:hypothetical protein